MGNAVLIQNPKSVYNDEPGICYHFPKMYLNRIEACQDDWVVFYEGKAGRLGYTSVQRLSHVTADPNLADHYYAWLDLDTLWQFERVVPRNNPVGLAYESSLRGKTGSAITGGAAVSAVRSISFEEFTAIVTAGLEPMEGEFSLPRDASTVPVNLGFSDQPQANFNYPEVADIRSRVLASRAARDSSFSRQIKSAYQGRCAISGLDLRNGGGRAEVQAAHIRPVKDRGPDIVQNGIALSGTLHWMFDRGLISVGDDYEILISENKVSSEIRQRLLSPSGRLYLPSNPRDHPHREYLRYHRENVFGNAA